MEHVYTHTVTACVDACLFSVSVSMNLFLLFANTRNMYMVAMYRSCRTEFSFFFIRICDRATFYNKCALHTHEYYPFADI